MDLNQERAGLIAQRDNAYAVYQQAIGAIAFIDALLESQKKNSLTLSEVKDALGAKEIGDVVPVNAG